MSIRRGNVIPAIFLAIFFLSLQFSAPASAELTGMQRLQSALGKFKTLSADFRQLVRDNSGEMVQQFEGRLHVKRPGRAFWQTDPPYAQTIVYDGKTLSRYDPDLQQLEVRSADSGSISQTPAMLFGGKIQDLPKLFVVDAVSDSGDGLISFVLRPAQPDALFRRLELRFRKGKPAAILLTDDLGQQVTTLLRKVRKNKRIDGAKFKFVPPPDTEVVFYD